jgi:protein-S-isoprenylcysteine O-methyltransferase Ste14
MWGEEQFRLRPMTEVPVAAAAAALCIVVGIAIVALGFRSFGLAKTTIDPVHVERASSLVTTGIYRVTRNPMYVGLTSVLLGWALRLSDVWTVAGPIFFALYITRFQIVPEERLLGAKFGAAYEDYCARVRRWL